MRGAGNLQSVRCVQEPEVGNGRTRRGAVFFHRGVARSSNEITPLFYRSPRLRLGGSRRQRPALTRRKSRVCLRRMKRERGEDAHEDAEAVEPPVKVDDAILSFEKELDQMSESNRVKTGK